MSENKIISPFQIIDWRILSFNSTNSMFYFPADIEHHWTIKAHIEHLDAEEEKLRAALQIEFHFRAEHSNGRMSMDGVCVAMCELDKKSMEDAETNFQRLLSRTAMTNCLANLRVFLLQAGALHQMGSKQVMLPFVNLNQFAFDEEITFTT